MPDRPAVKTRRITRDKLAQFLPTPELIRGFEDMTADVTETLPNAIEAATADSGSLLAVASFVRAPAAPPAFHNQASDILSGQIFGA